MERHKRNPNTECNICGKSIYRRPAQVKLNSRRVFCSSNCYGVSCRREHPCIVCKKPILAGLHKKTCSRTCANKHRAGIKYKIGGPKDKVVNALALKKRLIAQRGKVCERCGYDNYKILHVHHVDRDRDNNKLQNLELLCPNCHAEEHHSKRIQNEVN